MQIVEQNKLKINNNYGKINKSDLPQNWEIRSVGDICEKISNGSNVKQFDG
jgi:restriction endonuclease S subunit